MSSVIEVSILSKNEKLRLMESLWADLTVDDSQVPSPAWHRHELEETRKAYARGEVKFSDWPEAKARLRSAIS